MTGSRPDASILDAIDAPPPARAWLDEAQRHLADCTDPELTYGLLSAQARRRLGSAPLAADGLALETAAGPLPAGDWPLGDAARVLLLLQAVRRFPERETELVFACFMQGDELERAALVRGLALLPHPCRHTPVALEAGRTNSLLLYAALALDNPYPAACYDDHEFDQMVLKCLFTGLKLERVVGLAQRANPALSRMCEDYLDERVAAHRAVPRDIWLAMAPFASPRAAGLLRARLNDPDPEHRYYAALAAGRLETPDPALAAALAQRRQAETEPRIRAVLDPTHPVSS